MAPRRKWEYRDDMKFQTVYLLHGGGDDDTCVVRKSQYGAVRGGKLRYDRNGAG